MATNFTNQFSLTASWMLQQLGMSEYNRVEMLRQYLQFETFAK